MPNHVRTVVKFKNLKSEDDVKFILNIIASPALTTPTEEIIEWRIDFNKIIPEPRTEEECPEIFLAEPGKAIEEDKEKPWFNWFDWHIANWGTKWNAYDGYTKIGKSYITFVFSTAWNIAIPVIEKLSILKYDIDVKYADEDLGVNCGTLTYTSEQGWTHKNSLQLTNPYRFARDLWNKY